MAVGSDVLAAVTSAHKDWGRIVVEWNLENGSTLYFQLQSNRKDKQGWSRQLYANDIGAPCLKKARDMLDLLEVQ